MLDAELKSKINQLWDKFWSVGISLLSSIQNFQSSHIPSGLSVSLKLHILHIISNLPT
jgi:hypothetical protein